MMRDDRSFSGSPGDTTPWPPECPSGFPGRILLESVKSRAGGAATRRVFRGQFRNDGDTTAAVTLELKLPPPFLPSAPVLAQRSFTIAPGESLRVELGSTVGPSPSIDEVREAVWLSEA